MEISLKLIRVPESGLSKSQADPIDSLQCKPCTNKMDRSWNEVQSSKFAHYALPTSNGTNST